MAATTPLSTRCSTESGRAFILDPARSRLLLIWFLGVHALAAAALLTLDVGAGLETVLLAALAAHGRWRWPAVPLRVVRSRDGFWSVPDRDQLGLRLGPATRYGDWWMDLRLVAPGRRARVLLLRDQVDASTWRALQATLRESSAQTLS